jgi:hypothetical protein
MASSPTEILQLAKEREIPFVIGPFPNSGAETGDMIEGYFVSAVVSAPHGGEVLILELRTLPQRGIPSAQG